MSPCDHTSLFGLESQPSFRQSQEFLLNAQRVLRRLRGVQGQMRQISRSLLKQNLVAKDFSELNSLVDIVKSAITELQLDIKRIQASRGSLPKSRHANEIAEGVNQVLEGRLIRLIGSLRESERQKQGRQQRRKEVQVTQNKSSRRFVNQAIFLEQTKPLLDNSHVEIQQEIRKISGYFNQMATLVNIHNVWIDRIDQDTGQAQTWVERGRQQLNQVWDKAQSRRGLLVQVMVVVGVVGGVLVWAG